MSESGKAAATPCSAATLPDTSAPHGAEDTGERFARLIGIIEGEVIPRLLVSLWGSLTTPAERLGGFQDRNDGEADQLLASLYRLESLIREADAQAAGSSASTR